MNTVTQFHDLAASLVLAAEKAPPDEKVAPGLLGFVVVALVGLACWALFKSMTKQMRKVDFEEAAEEPAPGPAAPDRARPTARA